MRLGICVGSFPFWISSRAFSRRVLSPICSLNRPYTKSHPCGLTRQEHSVINCNQVITRGGRADSRMARRPEKKRQKSKPVQPPFPGRRRPNRRAPFVCPYAALRSETNSMMSLGVGMIAHPYTTGGGKSTNVRAQRADKPGATETRTWCSYEKVTVTRRADPSKPLPDATGTATDAPPSPDAPRTAPLS